MTRAGKRLYLSAAAGLNFDESFRYPSRFLLEIEDSLLEYARPIPERLRRDALSAIKASEKRLRQGAMEKAAFSKDDRVLHRIFGEGRVLSVDAEKGAYLIQFEGMGTPREISFKAKLQKAGSLS